MASGTRRRSSKGKASSGKATAVRAKTVTAPRRDSRSASTRLKRRPARNDGLAAALGRGLASHGNEVLGGALLLAGVLSSLGLWLDLLGPVGRVLTFLSGALLGLARHVLP